MRIDLLPVLLLHAYVRPLTQAWRAVDRAYVDKTFNGHPWFKVCCPKHVVTVLTIACVQRPTTGSLCSASSQTSSWSGVPPLTTRQ